MGRYLLLVVLAAPSLWTAYDEWRRGQEGPAAAAPATSAPLPIASREQLTREASDLWTAATAGRKVWAERALRLEAGGGAASEPADLPIEWKAVLAATTRRAQSLAEAQVFADRYRAAAPAETYPDTDPFRRALEARAVEVRLLRLRMNGAPVGDEALLNDYREELSQYVKAHGPLPEYNTDAHNLLKTWLRGNELLLKYPKRDLLTLLHTALADVRQKPDGPLFRPASLTKAGEAVRELRAYGALPGAAGDPLAPRVAALLADWEKDQGVMEKVKDWSGGPQKLRAVAGVAAALIAAGEARVTDQARAAARRLCDVFLPERQPLDTLVLIKQSSGDPKPYQAKRNEVTILRNNEPFSPLQADGPPDKTYNEFYLQKLVKDDATGYEVRFAYGEERQQRDRSIRLVSPTPLSAAAWAYNNARDDLAGKEWTFEQLDLLCQKCEARVDRPAKAEALGAHLRAILDNKKSFFPEAAPAVP